MPKPLGTVVTSVRRLRRSRRDPLTLVAAGVVAATLVLTALTLPSSFAPRAAAPGSTPLRATVLLCPGGGPGAGTVRLGSLGTAAGAVRLHHPEVAGATEALVGPNRTTDIPADHASTRLSVTGAAAAGLAAGRFIGSPLAGSVCQPPQPDYWYAGLGAGPTHDSVLEYQNPNDATAIVDVRLWGPTGAADIPSLRGVAVSGHMTVSFDLGKVAPRWGTFGAHVSVLRGQAYVAVRDRSLSLTGGATNSDWIPPQPAPSRIVRLLGTPGKVAGATLSVLNPSANQITATLKVITAKSIFVPANFKGVTVPANGIGTVAVGTILKVPGVLGIEVTAPTAVVANLESNVAGDLVISGPGTRVAGEGSVVVPDGDKLVVVAGADANGSVTVVARAADGTVLATKKVVVSPLSGAAVAVPKTATLLQILAPGRSYHAVVLVTTDKGGVVLPFRAVLRTASVPFVRPGLD